MVVMPKWGETTCAPIALEDAVDAIAAVIDRDIQGHEIFEIGSEIMQYGELLQRNGKIVRGKENRIYTMAWFPVSLVAWPISMITGVSRHIVAVLLGSLQNDSAYTANRFFELVGREPRPVDAALRDLAKEMEQW